MSALDLAKAEIQDYLLINNLQTGYKSSVYFEDYTNSTEWFRLIINDRFLFLKHIQNIVAIIRNYSDIHYDIKWSDGSSFKVFVAKGARKYTLESGFPKFDIDEFLQGISDTADSLYEECLFRYTHDNTPLNCTYSYCRDAKRFVLFSSL